MPKPIGVLAPHGMGMQRADYASALHSKLLDALPADVGADLRFQPVWYQGVMQGQQEAVWERMASTQIDQIRLRRFFLFYFSDAAACEVRPDDPDSVYRRVMQVLKRAIDALRIELGDVDRPVIAVCHSLGCQVLSNYIWDAQHGRGIWSGTAGPTPFQRLDTLSLLITCGCNIPLFVSALDKVVAIDRPNDTFRWLNFYDRDDVLGWPLKPLSTGFPNAYDQIVEQDIEIDTGFTPLSHTGYWEDRSFIGPVAELIESVHASAP